MANKDLNIIIRATDQVTKTIKDIGGGLENFAERNRRTFQKMAWYGTAAFAWITAWVMKTTQAAAEAEWTWNKFNTVFAEGADDMTQFVNDIRRRMPVATDTIARMAADLQDLLVPIGLSRELWAEMTQGFLEVSNAIGAFNDVDPSEVLEAIKSWLTWASQPLKKFWVDASVSALQVKAFEMGLLEAGQKLSDLEPAVQNQIKAQALLAQVTSQSSDAISWFEENSDSLIFRQLELKASLEDVSWTLGQAFLPIIDEVVKSLLPVVETVREWISENGELTLTITKWGLAITWIVAVLGTLWLAIPPIIVAIKWMGVVIGALLSPIWLLVAATAGLALAIHNDWLGIGSFIEEIAYKIGVIRYWLKDKASAIFGDISRIISNIWRNLWRWVENIMLKMRDGIVWWASEVIWAFVDLGTQIRQWATDLIKEAFNWGKNLVVEMKNWITGSVKQVRDSAMGVASDIRDYLGFFSPAKKWPWSTADKWMPNLISMLSDWLDRGRIWVAIASRRIAAAIGDWISSLSFESIQQKLEWVQVEATKMSDGIRQAITNQKSNIMGLAEEYRKLEDQIKQIELNIDATIEWWRLEVAQRAVQIEDELLKIKERESELQAKLNEEQNETTQKELEQLQTKKEKLKAEMQLAKVHTDDEQLQEARRLSERSQTEILLERIEAKVEEHLAEKERIEELKEAKKQQILDEHEKYKELVEQKKSLDAEYFNLFQQRLNQQQAGIKESITMMQRLNAMSWWGSLLDWARALWWPVTANRSYLVWENWPEMFTPASSGRINNNVWWWGSTININMWWVVVNNEADENRLIDKMKRALIRETQLFNNWIA